MQPLDTGIIGLAVLVCVVLQCTGAQLVVNVKNKGGDIVKESISANTSQDTVTLEFQKSDGTLVTQLIDFKNEIQILRALVLGEEELGQSQFQVMCFVTRVVKNEFISSDAMSKLRQKNPGAIRHPEDDKGQEIHQKDLFLDINRAHILSPYIFNMCQDAQDSTYTRDVDLQMLSKVLGKDYNILTSATKKPPVITNIRCKDMPEMVRPCMCQYEICVSWYPCGLKYCRGKDSSGRIVSYRCGIKTCRKCRLFEYFVKQKQQCIWDDLD